MVYELSFSFSLQGKLEKPNGSSLITMFQAIRETQFQIYFGGKKNETEMEIVFPLGTNNIGTR